MIVAGDYGILTAGEGMLLVFDAINGKPLQATMIGGMVASEPVLAGQDLALVSSLGYLMLMHKAPSGSLINRAAAFSSVYQRTN